MRKKKSQKESYARDVFQNLLSHKLAVFGIVVLIIMILAVIFLPAILHLDPYKSYIEGGFNQKPSLQHWFGTDRTGRDIFSRVIYGGRVSLTVGVLSTLISMLIGIPLGLIAGYFRGAVEMLIMRVADIFMSIPSLVLILVLVSVLGPSLTTITMVLGVLGWTNFARLIHSRVLSVREKEYIESARCIGTKSGTIMLRYLLPNVFSPCLIVMTFRTASSILMEASLSFLGLGVQPPTASWGNLMYDAQSIMVLSTQPWVWVPPGVCLILTVLSINFLGDGLRDALDPKQER